MMAAYISYLSIRSSSTLRRNCEPVHGTHVMHLARFAELKKPQGQLMTNIAGECVARALVVLGAALAPYSVSGAAATSPDGGTLEFHMASVTNYMKEACVDFARGSTLQYEFEAAYPVDFNIHHHTETTTEFPVKLRIEGLHKGKLPLPEGGEYCFMWKNPIEQPDDFVIVLRYRADTPDSGSEVTAHHLQAPARTATPE